MRLILKCTSTLPLAVLRVVIKASKRDAMYALFHTSQAATTQELRPHSANSSLQWQTTERWHSQHHGISHYGINKLRRNCSLCVLSVPLLLVLYSGIKNCLCLCGSPCRAIPFQIFVGIAWCSFLQVTVWVRTTLENFTAVFWFVLAQCRFCVLDLVTRRVF